MLGDLITGNITLIEAIIYILSSLIVIFLTMPIHEFAHGFVADKLGDPTPRYQGRLSFSPFAHIDYMGALCILLFGFGWAKPVEVNSYNFKSPKRDMALVALAGPLSNAIVALISIFISNIIFVIAQSSSIMFLFYIMLFFSRIALINIYLAVFNLIPVPPLDGSRLLAAFLPNKYYYALMRYERYIYFGLIALLFLGVFDTALDSVSTALYNILYDIAALPFKILR